MDSDSLQSTMKVSGIDLSNPVYVSEPVEIKVYKPPEKSEWKVWLMGDYGKSPHGAIVYQPNKGQEPNWFHRKMQELCFGFKWRKV
jgi:hypothetical protein